MPVPEASTRDGAPAAVAPPPQAATPPPATATARPAGPMGGPGAMSQVKGLDDLLLNAPPEVKQAALEWCMMNQVVDVGILFEDPDDVDMVIGCFLDALPLNPEGVYAKNLRRRLDEMRPPAMY